MIAVVTGSSGFIGSHLVNELLARGATVRALVRPQSTRTGWSATPSANFTLHEIDVLNAHAVAASELWNDATHVFHLAGLTTATSMAEFRLGNVAPLTNILSALSNRESPPRVVVVSSQAAAGPARSRELPVRESDTPAPLESYGVSKREAELVANSYADRLPIAIIRPPAVYGPNDHDFLAAFKQAITPVALHAIAPDHWFDLVHVSDVVNALIMAAENPRATGQTYFLASDTSLRWRDLYNIIAQCAGTKTRQLKLPQPLLRIAALAGDVFGLVTKRTPLINSQKLELARPAFWLCDSARIRTELGWQPQITPQIGVPQTYLWYVDAGWLSRKQGVAPQL
ncbi:MAG: NAD-dependent epimerase/dehydratase family protein [Gemmatimonadaceae bacterium]